jgi:hypothetical protein
MPKPSTKKAGPATPPKRSKIASVRGRLCTNIGPRAGIEGKLWRLPEYAHAGILYVEPLAVAQASHNGAARLSPQDRAVRQAPFAHRFFDDRGEPARDVAQELTAAIDRLFHQCTVVEIAGERYPAPGPRRDRAGTQVNAMCR